MPIGLPQLVKELRTFFTDAMDDKHNTVNNEVWTLADLLVRQELNNGCDGFGMIHVNAGYNFVRKHKEELIELNMISEDGYNNRGFPLWKGWDF